MSGTSQIEAVRHVQELKAKRHARLEQLYLSLAKWELDRRRSTIAGQLASKANTVASFPGFVDCCNVQQLSSWFQTHVMLWHMDWFNRFIAHTPATLMKADHTFKVQKRVKPGGQQAFTCCMTSMNELGQVLGVWFLDTQELSAATPIFTGLKARFERLGCNLAHIYTDNYCQWRAQLQSVWQSTSVRLDAYHFLNRFKRCLDPACLLTDAFMADLRKALFVRRQFTPTQLQALLERCGIDQAKAMSLSRDKKCQEINTIRHIPESTTLKRSLHSVVKK